MFPRSYNTQNSSQDNSVRFTTRGVIPEQVIQHFERYGLNDEAFTAASMNPEVRAQYAREQAAKLSLEEPTLAHGWLDDLNTLEINDRFVAEAKAHEPTAAERASGAEVEVIGETTAYIPTIRRSSYTAATLAGMRREDFDLAM
jgi:hypothetical protein